MAKNDLFMDGANRGARAVSRMLLTGWQAQGGGPAFARVEVIDREPGRAASCAALLRPMAETVRGREGDARQLAPLARDQTQVVVLDDAAATAERIEHAGDAPTHWQIVSPDVAFGGCVVTGDGDARRDAVRLVERAADLAGPRVSSRLVHPAPIQALQVAANRSVLAAETARNVLATRPPPTPHWAVLADQRPRPLAVVTAPTGLAPRVLRELAREGAAFSPDVVQASPTVIVAVVDSARIALHLFVVAVDGADRRHLRGQLSLERQAPVEEDSPAPNPVAFTD
jgi:hypothetical protein